MKSVYGKTSLKLNTSSQSFGNGFAELRFRRGNESNEEISEVNLREAYVTTYKGSFDFRIGHQIVVWGRADGINPTDNISPKNMVVRSPDADDKREGNFLIRSFYTRRPLRIEAVWVPVYRESVLPLRMVSLPPGVSLTDSDNPDPSLENSAAALKINLELPSFDGSLSYFNGFIRCRGLTPI